ncbi:hypothetical protein A176_004408 [Myxococcus hansupus]|uniref:Uncharacterized protein n=1 Tax=Pseudomyxococcus hansupus TaxID=1297742 RepID=A0A0H4WVU1_9BACT|nr:hypothetical protein A176_004408 [Myxococcus hansupus]
MRQSSWVHRRGCAPHSRVSGPGQASIREGFVTASNLGEWPPWLHRTPSGRLGRPARPVRRRPRIPTWSCRSTTTRSTHSKRTTLGPSASLSTPRAHARAGGTGRAHGATTTGSSLPALTRLTSIRTRAMRPPSCTSNEVRAPGSSSP